MLFNPGNDLHIRKAPGVRYNGRRLPICVQLEKSIQKCMSKNKVNID
jgi:hypothetical protein